MKFFTLEELSKIMKLHIETLRKYVRRGDLKAALFGREYRVSEEDLKAFYESKKKKAS